MKMFKNIFKFKLLLVYIMYLLWEELIESISVLVSLSDQLLVFFYVLISMLKIKQLFFK